MGFFSWITSDTNKSIANSSSNRKTFTVHMITENGLVFTEHDYEGYGEFGGKDIYVLIAEMNNLEFDNDADKARHAAIDLMYKTKITNGERTYTQGTEKDADFVNWKTPMPLEGGKTPNQLVKEGWKQVYPNGYGDWNIAAKNGLKLPKLVERIPDKSEFKQFWDKLPYPDNCPDQGCFYDDNDDDE